MIEEKNIEDLLKSIDPDFERLKKTPKRFGGSGFLL